MRSFAVFLLLTAASASAQTPPPAPAPQPFVNPWCCEEGGPTLIGGIEALQSQIVYPDDEREAGIEGRVIVQVDVDTTGVPREITVVRSVSAGLDSAAVDAMRASRFVPASQNERPMRVRMTLPVTFRLSDTPRRAPFRADTLLARLGAPWTTRGLPPPNAIEANAPQPGATRSVWTAPDAETERVEAVVVGDTLQTVTLVFAPGASALFDMRRLSNAIGALPVRPDSAGFYTAYDMAVHGFESRTDVSVDLPSRTWRLRAPGCTETGGCVGTYPVLIGGMQGLQAGIRYPRRARLFGTDGRVLVQFTVTTGGATRGAMPVGEGIRGAGSDDLTQAALDAVRAARFVPAKSASGEPIEARMTLPVTFRIR